MRSIPPSCLTRQGLPELKLRGWCLSACGWRLMAYGDLFTAEIAEDAEMNVNGVTEQTIGAAIQVHRSLGPGLLESAYTARLPYELDGRKLHTERQKAVPVSYKGVSSGYCVGLLINFNAKQLTKGVRRLVNDLPD